MYWEKYYFAQSIEETLELLKHYEGDARIMAGGTDLMVQFKYNYLSAKVMVDIGRIKELNHIRQENGHVSIGATTTHTALATSPYLQKHFQVLASGVRTIGSPQIRNAGTIGGNVANAQPAADGSIALVALGATICGISPDGPFSRPIESTFLNPGECALNSTAELITSFTFPAPGPRDRSAFVRHSRRAALALPIMNMGLWLRLNEEEDGIEDARIAIGPMARVPFRAKKTEAFLRGAKLSEAVLDEAGELTFEEVSPRDSFRGSAAYKKELVRVYLKRAVLEAVGERSVGK